MATKCKSFLKSNTILAKTKKHLRDVIQKLKLPRDKKVYERTLMDLETSSAKKILSSCAISFCNKGCKKSIFEDGAPNKIPMSIKKKYKTEVMRRFWLDQRKKLFGTKKTILKDSFYNKLSPKTVQRLKKEGAISGCAQRWFVD